MTANQDTIENAKRFVVLCDNIGNNIFEVCEAFTSQNYIDTYRDIGELREFVKITMEQLYHSNILIKQLKTQAIYRQQRRIAKYKTRKPLCVYSEEWKLDNGWKMCDVCDAVVLSVQSHKLTDKCRKADISKQTAVKEKTKVSDLRETRLKLENILHRNLGTSRVMTWALLNWRLDIKFKRTPNETFGFDDLVLFDD